MVIDDLARNYLKSYLAFILPLEKLKSTDFP